MLLSIFAILVAVTIGFYYINHTHQQEQLLKQQQQEEQKGTEENLELAAKVLKMEARLFG